MSEQTNRSGASPPSARKAPLFKGFPEFRSNVLYCPKQFFTVVIPHSPVNCIRLVSYMLRKTLGWVDETGEPLQERHEFSYRELEQYAGVAHSRLGEALELALGSKFITCVQKARMQVQGVRAQSAAYELCWDENQYTDTLKQFRGFYIAPTYLDSGGQTRLGRKNIPNVFFDYLVRNESRGVIRVVGTLLWYSIDWGKGGERRKPVKKSLRELVELTQLDKSSVVRALDEATEKAYIERVEPGVFDRSGQKLGSVTVYGIHWTNEYTYTYEGLPVESPSEVERSQNATRLELVNAPKMQHGQTLGTLPKRDTGTSRKRSQNATQNAPKTPHGERSQNATIRITNSTITNTPINNSSAEASPLPSSVAAASLVLTQAGFSKPVAEELAGNVPLEVITRQIELLPKRAAKKNPLGLLRRAIEENWPDPDTGKTTDVGSSSLGREFAASFYAGYHGNAQTPISEPSVAESEIAARFVSRILEFFPAPFEAATWGRQFGQFAAAHHSRKREVIPSLRLALQQYGDRFYAHLREAVAAERREKLNQARTAHFERFEDSYQAYFLAAFEEHQEKRSKVFLAFLAEEEETLRTLQQNRFGLNIAKHVEDFQARSARLERFQRFLMFQEDHNVLDFWAWDAQHNPQRFEEARV